MAELSCAILGCGAIANAYAQALDSVAQLELTAVVDPDEAARQRFAEATGAQPFASLAELPDVDTALVLAPPSHHEALTCALLARGAHVLCEKPLAPTITAAERMLQTAREHDRRLMMGSKFRYTPDVVEAHALLQQGVCGDAVIYENVFCSVVDMTQRWNAQQAVSGGGVLIDNGCHSVDLARHLLGPLARVQAQFGRRVQPLDVEDTARMLFESQSGALGSIDLSWSVHKETDAYVRLHGTAGTLEVGWKGSRYKSIDGAWQPFGRGYDKLTAFTAQLQNFADVCLQRAAPVIDDTDALASVVVIDRAYQSAREKRWVTIPS